MLILLPSLDFGILRIVLYGIIGTSDACVFRTGANENQVSLIGIINFEIAKFKGDRSFTIPYPVVEEGASAFGYFASGIVTHFFETPDYETYVANTIKYIDSEGFGVLYEMKRAQELIVMPDSYPVIKQKEAVFFLK